MIESPGSRSLIVVGGWGVDARMLQPVVVHWPGPVHFVSLDDRRLAVHSTVSELAKALIRQYSQPAVWLGWSQGAQVAMAAAAGAGTPVTGVVTLAGFPRFLEGNGWPSGLSLETFHGFRHGLATDPVRAWRRFQKLLIHGVPKGEARAARGELAEWIDRGPAATGSCLALGLEWLAREDQRGLWQSLELPALHLLAEADALVKPWQGGLALPASTETRVLSGMTHWPRGAQAEECGRSLMDFARVGVVS